MKLNIGCGEDYRDGWVNVDLTQKCHYGAEKKQKVDVICDIKINWPFKEQVAEYVLMQEVFEHVNRWDGLFLLKEANRVLIKGGTLELTVPPVEKQMKLFLAMINRPTSFEEFENAHQMPYNIWKSLDDIAGATIRTIKDDFSDMGDAMSHKSFYSKNMLKMLITYAGFDIDKMDDGIRVFAVKR